MIKIKNDEGKEIIVTQGAFEEYFEHLGYEIVTNKKQIKNDIVIEKETKDTKENIKVENKDKKENRK